MQARTVYLDDGIKRRKACDLQRPYRRSRRPLHAYARGGAPAESFSMREIEEKRISRRYQIWRSKLGRPSSPDQAESLSGVDVDQVLERASTYAASH